VLALETRGLGHAKAKRQHALAAVACELETALGIILVLYGAADILVAGEKRVAAGDLRNFDRIAVLGDLVAKYESTQHPVPPVSDAEMLRFLIVDAKGVSQAQVAAETGIPESTISEVLSGKRGLSRRNIGILSRYFHVSLSVFSFD
jgi:antitoxin component HigA of HigAB toxin-antitoxin module